MKIAICDDEVKVIEAQTIGKDNVFTLVSMETAKSFVSKSEFYFTY